MFRKVMLYSRKTWETLLPLKLLRKAHILLRQRLWSQTWRHVGSSSPCLPFNYCCWWEWAGFGQCSVPSKELAIWHIQSTFLKSRSLKPLALSVYTDHEECPADTKQGTWNHVHLLQKPVCTSLFQLWHSYPFKQSKYYLAKPNSFTKLISIFIWLLKNVKLIWYSI